MNSTYHTTLQATSTQLAFHHMPTSYMAHWQSIHQRDQAITDCDNLHKNVHRVPHMYSVDDLVLIHKALAVNTVKTLVVNLPNPLVHLTNWLMWHTNMSMVPLWLIWITLMEHSTFGNWFHLNSVIPRASPHYFPFGNYDWHILVITGHADPLKKSIHFLHQCTSPFTTLPSVFFYKEGLYISMQLNIDVAPVYQFATSSLSQSQNNHIYFSSYSFHSTLIF